MIKYREYIPSYKFRNIISCFWTMGFESGTVLPDLDIVLPDGCSDLLINMGPSFKRIDSLLDKEFFIKDYALIGQRKNAVEIQQTPDIDFFAIRFTPYGMRSIFPANSCDLTGDMVEEDVLVKQLTDEIRRSLERTITFPEKLRLIEHVLDKRLSCLTQVNLLVEKAVHQILGNKGNFNVNDFCEESKIHKSTLEKNFLIDVGLKPKEFASIIRFNFAHALLKSNRNIKLTHLALDCGYYDQSHMIKDFKKFSNHSPIKLKKANFLLPEIAVSSHQSLRS